MDFVFVSYFIDWYQASLDTISYEFNLSSIEVWSWIFKLCVMLFFFSPLRGF